MWGLPRYCRSTGADPALIATLDRATSGDPGGDIGFLGHDEVYDGFDGPPRLLTTAAVADAAAACGFGRGFDGDVRAYLVEHFTAMREFYAGAARRGQCVIVWTD